jgi:hypothetical protein
VLAPELVRLVGLNVPVAPEGKPLIVSAAEPVKPFTALTVIVSVALEPPAVTVGVFVDADTVKLLTPSITVAVLLAPPFVPVIVNMEFPARIVVVVLIVSVLVPDPDTEVGLNVAVAPEGNPVALRFVVPVAATMTVTVPLPPAFTTGLPEADSVKKFTCNVAGVDCTALPLVPVIVNG